MDVKLFDKVSVKVSTTLLASFLGLGDLHRIQAVSVMPQKSDKVSIV